MYVHDDDDDADGYIEGRKHTNTLTNILSHYFREIISSKVGI